MYVIHGFLKEIVYRSLWYKMGLFFFLLLYGGIFKIFLCLIFVDYGKYHFIECSLFYFHLLYGGWTLCPPHLVVSLFI